MAVTTTAAAARATAGLSAARRIAAAWLIGDVVIIGLHLLAAFLLPTGWIRSLLHLDGELNAPAWFSSAQIAFAAWTWGAIAITLWLRDRRVASGAGVVMIGLLFASIDEGARIHEQLAQQTLDPTFPRTGYWVLIYLPVLVCGLAAVLLLAGRMLRAHAQAFRVIAAGGLLFLLSAGGIELLLNATAPGSVLEGLQILAEESGELLAVTLGLYGSLRLLVELRSAEP